MVGIVSEADLLLKVFLRADAEIAQEIRQEVLLRAMWVNPDTIVVDVSDGIVTLTGQLERRSLIPIAVSLVRAWTAWSTWSTGSPSRSTTARSLSLPT